MQTSQDTLSYDASRAALKAIDGHYLDALDGIRARSIARFGDDAFRMEADGDAGDQGGDDAGADDADKGADEGGQDKASDDAKGDDSAGKGKTFDESYVKGLRDEAASHRTEKQQLKSALDGIAKLLNPEAGDKDKIDPAEMATQLTTERSDHAALQREHQALRSAIKVGADHDALLDSRGFLAKLADLDPKASNFASKVEAAVKAAVEANPKLKAQAASGSSSADHGAGGSGESTKRTPKSVTDAVAGYYGT